MKVLHVLNSSSFSGAENVVCQIIKMFEHDSSFDMAYCSIDGPIREMLEEMNIMFYPISAMKSYELKRVITIYRPDIIHAHDMRANFFVASVCRRIPLISHIHNNAFDSRRLSSKSIAYFFAAKKAKKIIWVSKSSYEGYVFHNFFRNKSCILYNVINRDELIKRAKQDKKEYDYDVSYVGRITYPKNLQRLMEILEIVCDELSDLKVAIVGTGEEEEEIKKICKKLGLDNNVDFLGYKKNPLKLLGDSKVMVITSRWEGTPMVALEAISLGVPIVSTPTDGMKDLIDNGVNGYLTDDNREFSRYIIELVKCKTKHREFVKNQCEFSERINDLNHYMTVLKEIYNNSL